MVRAASSGLWSAPPQRAARGPAVVHPGNGYRRYRTAGPFLLARRRRAADPRRHLPRAEFRYDAQAADSPLLRAKVWSRRSGPPRVRYRAFLPERQPAGRFSQGPSAAMGTSPVLQTLAAAAQQWLSPEQPPQPQLI